MSTLTKTDQPLRLRTVIVQAAQHCSHALTQWFQRPVRVESDGFEELAIGDAGTLVGDPDDVVVAIRMGLLGELSGDILLVIPEKTACVLCDVMMQDAPGTRTTLGELEFSCLQETANIVGSALTNSMANWAGLSARPTSPEVIHDLACATIEPVISAQAVGHDRIMLARSTFELDGMSLAWGLLLLPSSDTRASLADHPVDQPARRVTDALNLVAASAAHHASDALSKWFSQPVELRTRGFATVPVCEMGSILAEPDAPVIGLHLDIVGGFAGHVLIALREQVALALIDFLMGRTRGTTRQVDEDGASCLQETANIVASAFVNSVGDWVDRTAAPGPPKMQHDLACALVSPVVTDLAAERDELLICRVDFLLDGDSLEWSFVMAPPAEFADLAHSQTRGINT